MSFSKNEMYWFLSRINYWLVIYGSPCLDIKSWSPLSQCEGLIRESASLGLCGKMSHHLSFDASSTWANICLRTAWNFHLSGNICLFVQLLVTLSFTFSPELSRGDKKSYIKWLWGHNLLYFTPPHPLNFLNFMVIWKIHKSENSWQNFICTKMR